MLRSFDPSSELQDLKLQIAKPDKTIIGELSEAMGKRFQPKLGNINEINFSLPYKIDIRHQFVDNPNIDKMRDRFLIKAEYNGKSEWYRITNINLTGSDKDNMAITALSLGIELSDKSVRNIKEVSKNANDMMRLALKETPWNVGEIHTDFLGMYREFDIPDTTRLDFIFRIAETFRGILVWDTESKTIDLHTDDSLARNRGLSFSYGRYIKSIAEDRNSNEMVTRMIPHGKDGLTIHGISSTGAGYIDDFSFFLYPFHRDKSKNVISSSNYMSDELAHAILDYTELIQSKEGEYKKLLDSEKSLQTQARKKEDEISALAATLDRTLNAIDLELSKLEGDATTLQATRNSLIDQIKAKEREQDSIFTKIRANKSQKDAMETALSMDVNFTLAEQIELNDSYIIEKNWTNEHITNAEDLLKEAREEFKILRSPETIFTLSVVNFMMSLESQRDWGKLHLGDIVTIQYEQLGISVTAKIIEFTIDFDGNSIDLTIANTADILDAEGRFFQDLYNFKSSTSIINSHKGKWDKVDEKVTNMDEIINGKLDAVKRGIIAGVNNTITIDGRGIRIRDHDDPDVFLVAQNSVLAITNNGGETWDHAITPTGIVGERIFGKLLAGSRLVIDATNEDGENTFTVDSRGVQIRGSSLQIFGGLSDSEISSSDDWNNTSSVVDDNKYKWERASFINPDGTFNSSSLKGQLTDDQLRSANKWNGQGTYIDHTGVYTGVLIASQIHSGKIHADRINTNDLVTNRLIMKNGNDVLINANTRTIDFRKFNTIVGELTADNINVNTITIRDANITGSLSKPKLDLNNNLKDTNVNNNFVVDRFGNVTIRGNITMHGGTISWANVTTPTASQIGAKPNSYTAYDDIGHGRLTELRSDGIYTGTLSAVTGYFSGELRGGKITSNTSIDVSTYITVGNEITLGGLYDSATKRIRFSNGSSISSSGLGTASISMSTNYLELHGGSEVNFRTDSLRLNGTLLPTASSGTVYDANRLGGVLASSYSRTSHNHHGEYTRNFGSVVVGFEFSPAGHLNIFKNNSYYKTIDL